MKNIEAFLPWIQILVVPLIGWVSVMVNDIKKELRGLGDRLIKVEDFRDSHEKWCAERNDKNERDHGSMSALIDRNERTLHSLRSDIFEHMMKYMVGK